MKKLFALLLLLMFATPVFAETVVYNPNSGKYHKIDCEKGLKTKKKVYMYALANFLLTKMENMQPT